MSIKFSIPTNWEHDLLVKVNKESVSNLYGKLNTDLFGGGRVDNLPIVNKNEIKNHISQAHSYGLKFNYLLNSMWMDDIEWTRAGQKNKKIS